MTGHTDNAVTIAAPMDLVWDRTNDLESWPDLFSEYESVEILERREGTIRFRLTMKPDRLGTTWSWVSDRTPDAQTRTCRSHRVETGPFKYMSLFWEYLQTPDGVRMRWVQDFEMKPDAPIGDDAMADQLNRNTAAQQRRIRQTLEAEAAEAADGAAGQASPVPVP
jgi:aromatase